MFLVFMKWFRLSYKKERNLDSLTCITDFIAEHAIFLKKITVNLGMLGLSVTA